MGSTGTTSPPTHPASSSFDTDPLSSHSERFPLARPWAHGTGSEPPSPVGIRPWNLRALRVVADLSGELPPFGYDHERQIAVDAEGRALHDIIDGTSQSATDNDGDLTRNEDFVHDFIPDGPAIP